MSSATTQVDPGDDAPAVGSAGGGPSGFSLVRDDPMIRVQRRLGLVPAGGLGVVRRAVFWSMVAWLPLAVWAAVVHRLHGPAGEPLLAHFGIHARFLIAVPLMILAEAPVHATLARLLPQFVRSGLVRPEQVPELRAVVAGVARRRDASLPWVAILALIATGLTTSDVLHRAHEAVWASDVMRNSGVFGFGGWWFLYVGRPIYLTHLLGWVWRTALLVRLFRGIARLDLSLVPTHPDRAGGLGFLAEVPAAFAPVVLATSVVVAGVFAHEVLYHGTSVHTFRVPMLVFVVLATTAFLLPLLAFAGPLAAARRRALLEYGSLVSRHGRLVRERWIEGREPEDTTVLNAPELGPVADVAALYDAIRQMRPVPLTRASVLPVALAAGLPLLAVLAIEVPIAEMVQNLLKLLF